ncbi:MAG: DUF5989 family protein [Planctomycetota bacterium]|nr:DUF5989 family protein [Planctomycetota bacterium]
MLNLAMADFLGFLRENKIWWITPLILVLILTAYLYFTTTSGGIQADEGFQYDMY